MFDDPHGAPIDILGLVSNKNRIGENGKAESVKVTKRERESARETETIFSSKTSKFQDTFLSLESMKSFEKENENIFSHQKWRKKVPESRRKKQTLIQVLS